MTSKADKKWIICKFGGTSVSSLNSWNVILNHVRSLTDQGFNVCIVVSAVSEVTNQLEKVLIDLRKHCDQDNEAKIPFESDSISWLEKRHQKHCNELGVAISTITDILEDLYRLLEGMHLTGDVSSPRLHARVLSYGEILSSHIGAKLLSQKFHNLNIGLIDARKILISSRNESSDSIDNSSNDFLNANVIPFSIDFSDTSDFSKINSDSTTKLSKLESDKRALFFQNYDVVITQGFIASTPENLPCILGRGGSDTSGALFAAALSAHRLEIWTDVDGIYSSDPRFVSNATLINELSYREAQELAAMGR